MSSSMKAAIHLGPKYLSNPETYKNTKFNEIGSLFKMTQKLVMEHSEEILNVKCLEYSSPFWARSVLSHDQAIKWAKAKVCVYADSVPCVRQMKDTPGAIERWTGQVGGLRLYSSYRDAVGIDGAAIEFEWTNFPGFSTLTFLQEIQKDLEEKNIQPENFKDRIIFMSMFNDILWKKNDENCISNAEKVMNYSKRFLPGHWTFLDPGSEKKWYGSSYGQWDCTANKMVQ